MDWDLAASIGLGLLAALLLRRVINWAILRSWRR